MWWGDEELMDFVVGEGGFEETGEGEFYLGPTGDGA